MSDFEVKILNAVRQAVKAAWDIEPDESILVVETPKDTSLGDYATSVALKLSRTLRRNPMDIAGPIVEKLNQLLEEGLIRSFGGSNWTHKRVAEANAYAESHGLRGFTAVSPYYGLAVQYADPFGGGCIGISGPENAEARAYYKENDIPVIPYSSIGAGFFSGRIKSGDPDGAREVLSRSTVRGYCFPENFERLRRAEILASEKGYTVAQIAMAFVLNQDLPMFPIVSSHRIEAMKENVEATKIKLTREELDWLDLLREER